MGVPLLALFLQAFLPMRFPFFSIFDLPLLVTIYFAMARRNPISGLFTGAAIGLVQDMLGPYPIGIYGIAKTVVGYGASSLGVEARRGKRRRSFAGDTGILSGSCRGLFHRGSRHGQHDAELELGPRHPGRLGQCSPGRVLYFRAGQVQAEDVKPVLSSRFSVTSRLP